MMELLWSDVAYLLVIGLFAAYSLWQCRDGQNRKALRQFFANPQALVSGLVVLLFLLISLADSIRIQRDNAGMHSASLLDYALAPLGQMHEKSYSKPLALRLMSPEIVIAQDGSVSQRDVRLQYPSTEIHNNAERNQFLLFSGLKALTVALLLSVVLVMCLRVTRGRFELKSVHWAMLGCLFCVGFLSLGLYWISRELHVFGTGKIGEDIFYYSLKSVRTGMIIGILTTLTLLPLSVGFGLLAGYYGGLVDDVVQYIYTTLSSVPGVLLISASVLSLQTYIANHPQYFSSLESGADARLLALCIILGITSWTSLCRIIRAETLKIRELDYIASAKTLGTSSCRILFRHILPNLMPVILITIVLDFSFLVLAEAVLSYVGVGVSPLTMSWGNLINSARLELAREPVVWWPICAAFSLMFTLVMAANVFSDRVRDALSPHS